jgi:hypothetical protein
MRTSKYYKLFASIVLVSTITMSATNLFAQRRTYKEEATRYDERRRNMPLHDYNKRDKYNKSKYIHRNNNRGHKHENNDKKSHHKYHKHYSHKKYNHHKHHRHGHVEHRCYRGDHYRGYHAHHRKYHHKYHTPHYRYKHYYNRYGHSCYNHSRYGEVIWRFASEPRVIHHRDGDYYYSDGCYYKYYPEFGFVHVDVPNAVYFSRLPDDCHRVRVHGEVYYTDGDLCFVRHRKGFRLIKAPTGIHFSLKF